MPSLLVRLANCLTTVLNKSYKIKGQGEADTAGSKTHCSSERPLAVVLMENCSSNTEQSLG